MKQFNSLKDEEKKQLKSEFNLVYPKNIIVNIIQWFYAIVLFVSVLGIILSSAVEVLQGFWVTFFVCHVIGAIVIIAICEIVQRSNRNRKFKSWLYTEKKIIY